MISVIIPLYNAEKTIRQTLESIQKQSIGSHLFEIIIVNDGSTDKSLEEVQRFQNDFPELKIQLLHQENKGVSAARNTGLKMAKGELIALVDSDDVWLPQKTERQLSFLENPLLEIDFIACERNGDHVRFPYFADKNGLAEVSFRQLLLRNGIANTAIFKKSVIEKSGLLDEKMRHAEDLDFYYRVSLKNKMVILDESLVITGNGKKSFGVSGLSADLQGMEKGFQYSLKKLRKAGALSMLEFYFYKMYFSIKYFIRKLR